MCFVALALKWHPTTASVKSDILIYLFIFQSIKFERSRCIDVLNGATRTPSGTRLSGAAWLLKGCVTVDNVVPLLASTRQPQSRRRLLRYRWSVAKGNTVWRVPTRRQLRIGFPVFPPLCLVWRSSAEGRRSPAVPGIALYLLFSGLVVIMCPFSYTTLNTRFDKGDKCLVMGSFSGLCSNLFSGITSPPPHRPCMWQLWTVHTN